MSPELNDGALGKFDKYKIDLKGMRTDSCRYEFVLDNQFFADIDNPDIAKGNVHVMLSVKKTSHAFELHFRTEGIVWVLCDRCLDEMEQPVASEDDLVVKFGPEYAEEGDNLVIIPEDEGILNVAWFMYEFVALAIPMKHVHAPGKCNQAMSRALDKHLRVLPDDPSEADVPEDGDDDGADGEGSTPIDPRWNELKKLLDNN